MGTQDFIKLSVCDLLKIGIGSSSSHTLAPWLAARDCHRQIKDNLKHLKRVRVDLYGSLAYVGRGHYTTLALPLGLLDQDQKRFNVSKDLEKTLGIPDVTDLHKLTKLKFKERSSPVGYEVRFVTEPNQPEKMTFRFTWDQDHIEPTSLTYYSYGGGSWGQSEPPAPPLYPEMTDPKDLSYPYRCADELLGLLNGLRLSDAVFRNEIDFARYRADLVDWDPSYKGLPHDEPGILVYLWRIAAQMGRLIADGFTYPDDDQCYKVMYAKPKAKEIFHRLFGANIAPEASKRAPVLKMMRRTARGFGFGQTTELVSAMALAVAEQNAALRNVVTAPTNGACGVVPAVLYYYVLLHASKDERNWLFGHRPKHPALPLNNICRFLLVANAVGGIVKANANIAGGLGGCQAEIGTASAMAAGALTEVLGGSPTRVFQAAEAALESHLGSVCDPIGGLVEIPCIERNLTGALTAISVARELLALEDGFETVVPFDKAVETMENISNNMDPAYKESSTGGLAKTMLEDVKACRGDLFPEGAPQTADGMIPVFRTTC